MSGKPSLLRLWLRWTWRDLRAHWLQVLAIALVISLGTGVFAATGNNGPWRQTANDASYALLHMYDLRVVISGNGYLKPDELLSAARSIPSADRIDSAQVRLSAPILVDASTSDKTILVPGRIIGLDLRVSEPLINGVHVSAGRSLTLADDGQPVAILESNFADYYKLESSHKVKLSGGREITAVGIGTIPDYFMVFTEEGGMMAEANFAALFAPLSTAQQIADRAGLVNELLIRLKPGADIKAIQLELESAIPDKTRAGVAINMRDQDQVYRTLYDDIANDGGFYNLVGALFLAAASFGAFNLASRMIDAQRRQIGINMALGVPPWQIAIRPLLVSLQIATLGAILGIGIGMILGNALGQLLRTMLPLPIFETPFRFDTFVGAALLGVILPFAATLYPVWRAIRVEPIDAMTTGQYRDAGKRAGLVPLLARIPLPGRSLTQLPFRNLMRAPRRTVLTLLAIAAAIMTLISVMGVLDSAFRTIDFARTEMLGSTPDRVAVMLDFVYPADSDFMKAIADSPTVARSEPMLRLGGTIKNGDRMLDTVLDLLPTSSAIWTPTILIGRDLDAGSGLVIAQKAAADLGVKPGDLVTFRHPKRTGLFTYDMVESQLPILGIHAGPLRFQTYMGSDQASMFGIPGFANMLTVIPSPGKTPDDVTKALFARRGVVSVQPISATIDLFEALMGLLLGFLEIVVYAVLLMALLIAYNATSITTDERTREIATLFAFGVPVRTVLRMNMVENLVVGVVGTVIGLALGWMTMDALLLNVSQTTLPEISVIRMISPGTILLTILVGVVVVGLAPILTVRKLARTDVPSALRVME